MPSPKIGHHYTVNIRVSVKRWYPDQGGSEEKKDCGFSSDTRYEMICIERGLPACHSMIELLLAQDHGAQGVHEGIGVKWTYVIDKVAYRGEVRL